MSQKKKVLEQLNKNGYVSRNWAIQNYITRLSAIILTLKKEGLKLDGEHLKTQNRADYIYRFKMSPMTTQVATEQDTPQDRLFNTRFNNY